MCCGVEMGRGVVRNRQFSLVEGKSWSISPSWQKLQKSSKVSPTYLPAPHRSFTSLVKINWPFLVFCAHWHKNEYRVYCSGLFGWWKTDRETCLHNKTWRKGLQASPARGLSWMIWQHWFSWQLLWDDPASSHDQDLPVLWMYPSYTQILWLLYIMPMSHIGCFASILF